MDAQLVINLAVAITNAAVAVGTIVLAYFAYHALREGRTQLKVLASQTAVARSQQDPDLRLAGFGFDADKLRVKLTNRGVGRARMIGVECRFLPTFFQANDERGGPVSLTPSLLDEHVRKGESVAGSFLLDTKTGVRFQKWNSTKPGTIVCALASKVNRESYLDPEDSQDFELVVNEPRFKLDLDKTHYQNLGYSELRKTLLESGVRFADLSFTVACKDGVDRPVYGETRSFVADLAGHQTLQEACHQGYELRYSAVGRQEHWKKIGWLDGEIYRRERSQPNLPPPWSEEMEG